MATIPTRERRVALLKSTLCFAISIAILTNELVFRESGPTSAGIFLGIFFLGFVPLFQVDRGDGKLVAPIVLLAHLISGGAPPPRSKDQKPNGD